MAPAEVRPAPNAKRRSLHWLDHRGRCNVAEWWDKDSMIGEGWFLIGVMERFTPAEMAQIGRVYMEPAIPPAECRV